MFYSSLYVGVLSFKQVQPLEDLIINILNLTNVCEITYFDSDIIQLMHSFEVNIRISQPSKVMFTSDQDLSTREQ